MNDNIVAINLERLLKEKGMTPYRFVKFGLSHQTVLGILEHGNPKTKTLQKLARGLGVYTSEFFKGEIKWSV